MISKNKTILIFVFLIFSINSFSQYDTLSVYFDFDKSNITYRQKIKISSFVMSKEKDIYDIKILGYADFKGSSEYNVKLSQQRANAIYNYIINAGIKADKIISCLGRGKIEDSKDKDRYLDRRVDIIYKCKCKEQDLVASKDKEQKQSTSTSIETAKKGDTFVLNNLIFIGGRHILLDSSYPYLEELLKILKQHPNLEIEIQGHICCQRSGDGVDIDTGKNNLSLARAQYIYDYLVKNGIDASRLNYKGFGADRRLKNTNINDYRNRRVEIMVTGT
jgi:outer membrane protein OmpA-like peptidoglycan-associated protein